MGIQGFPTLKIVKPGPKPGRPVVEDYNGPRSTKAIVEAVKDKIPNHVKRLQGEALEKWLNAPAPSAKAIVFTDKGVTSPLVKSLAIDFLGNIAFAQVRDKSTAEKYGVSEFPSVRLVPAQGESPVAYDGEVNRASLVSFFSQIAPPNPDPAPKDPKASKSSSKTAKPARSSSASAAFSKASEAHKSSDFDDHLAGSGTIILDDDVPTESPLPIPDPEESPMVVPETLPPIPTLATPAELEAACLMPKSGNCILVLLPLSSDTEEMLPQSATSALGAMAEIADKYGKRRANMIPMYAVPADNQAASQIRDDLNLSSEDKLEIIATNVKRSWWRRYSGDSYDILGLESFVDAIKLGEGSKSTLPEGFGATAAEAPASEATEDGPASETIEEAPAPEPTEEAPAPEPADEAATSETSDDAMPSEPAESVWASADPEPEETPLPEHDEL